jgi:integral membrane protein (TIGR01906 family)
VRILLSLATAISILAVALLLLLTPIWTHWALDASGSTTYQCQPSGVCPDLLTRSTSAIANSDQTINALLFTGDFSFRGVDAPADYLPFYSEAEQSHMRDVRVVLYGFLLLALVSLVFVVASLIRGARDAARWKAVSRGGIWLIVGIVVLGVFAFVAFDTVFTLFHEIFFPGGNWSFPADSNLIRLYPEAFWELSSLALGVLCVIGGSIVWFVARRRANAVSAA